jgi:hypothetical protein
MNYRTDWELEMFFPTFDDSGVISHLEADCDTRVHVEMDHVLP